MITKESKIPFFAKVSIFLVGLFALFTILYIGRNIIIPIVFAVVISILLHPIVNFFVRKKINRVIAIFITIILAFIAIAALGGLIFSQASRFGESWPSLVNKITLLIHHTVAWASGYFNINAPQIDEWIANAKSALVSAIKSSVGPTLVSVGGGMVAIGLIPVYIVMILFYQPLLIDFVRKLSAKNDPVQVKEIITQIKTVIQRYLIGLVIEFVIIAVLYTATLLVLGIDYAILIGIIGALVNVIPYIGGFVGIALPMMVALATKDSAWYSIYILVIFYFIQVFDNHFIIPKIVASKVKINALFAIMIVLVGNALWGISGMFLSIPLLAIVKLVFDHIEPLKPWGFLLGDTMPKSLKIIPIRLKRKKKKSA